MERLKIIKNESGKHPVYYLIDSITGRMLAEALSKDLIESKKKDFNLYAEFGIIESL